MIYSSKEKAKPGTYKCTICGLETEHTKDGESLSPCSKCNNIKWEKLV